MTSYITPAVQVVALHMLANHLDYAECEGLPSGMMLVDYIDGIWITQETESCSLNDWLKIECVTKHNWKASCVK